MSQENVELVRRTVEAFNQGGAEALLPFLDPQVEWHDLAEQPDAAVHHGHQGVLEAIDRWLSAFGEDYRAEPPDEILDRGDQVVTFSRHTAGAPERRAGVYQEVAGVWTVRGGLVVRACFFSTREQALEAVERSEQDAHAERSGRPAKAG